MVTKEQAKEGIKKLTAKYQRVLDEKRVNKYTEEGTKKDFIEPFFELLEWNVRDQEEVTAEDRASKGHVDYGFKLNGVSKFVLEAKPLKADLEDIKWAEQAIDYAWHKGVSWAILTDFEGLKLFNADWKKENPLQSTCLSLKWNQYLDRFDDLWLLSKDSFERGVIDNWATRYGRVPIKHPVGEQLLASFIGLRALLTKDIIKHEENKKFIESEEELDEAVQRILDRIIFVRTCEDKQFEDKLLVPAVREWESRPKRGLYKEILELFQYFNENYDSKLFQENIADKLKISDDVVKEVIRETYETKDGTIRYDFSFIDADVLGSIYENYLGHILKKTEKRAKIKEAHAHRKEMGIYYTPTYIVDYIVRNTLGELLKTKKPEEIPRIKVLDPACGSGSFLIKAVDVIAEAYTKKLGKEIPFSKKREILLDNIHGVDLDPKAAEIAQLNLLLKTLEKKQLLPLLKNNIKVGNSLIDDPDVAGDKAFKWEEEFKKIMDEGGFDIVVGNPPYVNAKELVETQSELRNHLDKSSDFETLYQKWDLYVAFIERGLKLLKDDSAYFSMIIPLPYVNQMYAKKSRQFITNRFSLRKIVDLSDWKIFPDATVKNCIVIVSKPKKINNEVEIIKLDAKGNFYVYQKIRQDRIGLPETFVWNIKNIEQLTFSGKNFIQLGDCCFISIGMVLNADEAKAKGQFKKKDLISKVPTKIHKKKYVEGKDIDRYSIPKHQYLEWDTKRVPDLIRRPTFPELYEHPKVLINKLGEIKATLDTENLYCEQTIRVGVLFKYLKGVENKSINNSLKKYYKWSRKELEKNSETIDYRYLLGFLNSKLAGILLNQIRGSDNIDINPEYLKQLPIRIVDFSNQNEKKIYDEIIRLVDKMLSLNKRLNELSDKQTDERAKIEEEIKKTDREIDELVYKIYGITEKEKNIIEESLKNK